MRFIWKINFILGWVSSRGFVANLLDYDIVVIEFELQSRYYVQFWANALGKVWNNLILPVIGYNCTGWNDKIVALEKTT